MGTEGKLDWPDKHGMSQHVDAFFPTLPIITEFSLARIYDAISNHFPIPQPRNALRVLHLAAVPATLNPALTMCDVVPTTRPQWKNALDELPGTPKKIPAFFFAHGRTFFITSEHLV